MARTRCLNNTDHCHTPLCCRSCPRRATLLSHLLLLPPPPVGKQTPWLDDKHVVFGEVVDGARTVKDIELLGSNSGKTSKAVRAC